jgi:heme o synthase
MMTGTRALQSYSKSDSSFKDLLANPILMDEPMSVSTTVLTPTAATPPAEPRADEKPKSLLAAHLELGKVRLNALVVFTTLLGFVVGAKLTELPFTTTEITNSYFFRLAAVCAGTFLTALGVSSFNQAIEAPRDARMRRTCRRPLVTGRLSRTYGATLGLIASLCGVGVLWHWTNGLTAALAAGNVLLYLAIYTPLKPHSTLNTLVGALVGGVPPIIGWSAATGTVSAGAWVLGAILFAWQIPHFLALSWMYREDYANGGFKMLPAVDPSGRLTGSVSASYAALLLPLCVMLAVLHHAGLVFVVVACILTAAMTAAAIRFALTRTQPAARRLFFASIIYLPLLCAALMLDARGPLSDYEATPAGYRRASDADQNFIDPSGPEAARLNAALAPQASATTPAALGSATKP